MSLEEYQINLEKYRAKLKYEKDKLLCADMIDEYEFRIKNTNLELINISNRLESYKLELAKWKNELDQYQISEK